MSFQAKGPPEPLLEALKLLLTGQKPAAADSQLRRRYDNWDLVRADDEEAAKQLCRDIAEIYDLWRTQEAELPSLTGLRQKLASIETFLGNSAKHLKNLTGVERESLVSISDYSGTSQGAKIADLFSSIADENYFPDPDSDAPGTLVLELEKVSLLMHMISISLSERYGRRRIPIPDAGPPLLAAPSIWRLVDSCWRIFSVLGLETGGTVGGPLYDFISAIDLWVTGNHSKIEHSFKSYIPLRSEYEKLSKRYQQLRCNSRRYAQEQFDTAVLQRQSQKIPPRILSEALSNESRRIELEMIFTYGLT